jgi:hypothetical protein
MAIAQRICDPTCAATGFHINNTDHNVAVFCTIGFFVRNENDSMAISLIVVEFEQKFSATSSISNGLPTSIPKHGSDRLLGPVRRGR